MARMLNSFVSSLLVSSSTLAFNSSFSALRLRISFGAVLTDPVDGLFFDGVLLNGLFFDELLALLLAGLFLGDGVFAFLTSPLLGGHEWLPPFPELL